MLLESPPDVLAVDEVPLERLHIEDVQIQRVRLHAVQLAVGRTYLWLSLIEIALRARLAVELLDLVAAHVEQVAVVGLLVASREASEYEDVLVRNLEQPAALETYPVRVLLDLQIKRLPGLSPLQVKLLNQVCALAPVEAGHHV